MADEEGQEGGDPAAEAFERLRAEVERLRGETALVRRAVEGIAAEEARQEVPNYSETLGHIQKGIDAATNRLGLVTKALADAPALAMTPEQMAQRIAAAGAAARREDQAALATARKGLEDVTRQLDRYVVSGRTGDEQNRWLAWTAIGGVVLGIVLWAVFAGPILRATPDSWRWPESMAARTLDMPPWTAQSARSCDFGHLGEHVGNGLVVVDDRPCEERRSAPIRERRYEPWRFEWGSDRLLEPEFFGHRVRDRQSGDGTTGIGGSA